MQYGHFDSARREYVIDTPATPLPWINYLGDGKPMDGKVHDPQRIDFLHRYLLELKKGIDEGVPVLGYLHWSFMDNFEWAQGYDERFGVIYVDYRAGERTPKDSAAWYAKVIETNGGCL